MAVVYFRCLTCNTKTPAETDIGIFVCPLCLSRFDIKKTIVAPKNPWPNKNRTVYREQPKIPFPMKGDERSPQYYSAPPYGADGKTLPNYVRHKKK